MTTITILRRGPNGNEERRDIQVPRPPTAWDIGDAKAFLHALQKESATTDCPLKRVERIHIQESDRPNVIVIEVVTNAGVVVTEPFRVSSLALTWLQEVQFDVRAEAAPAPSRRRRTKPPVTH